jgi:hypothetical protein
MYFVLRPVNDKNAASIRESPKDPTGKWSGRLNAGKPVTGKVPVLQAKTSPDHGDKLLDVVRNSLANLIVTEAFLDALDAAGVRNYQRMPLIVNHHADRKKHDYFMCNVVGLIECLDRKKAKVEWDDDDPGQVFVMTKLAIDAKKVAAHNDSLAEKDRLKLFRLQEAPRFILADDTVRDAVEKAKITGVEFKKPEECGDFK